MNARSPCLVWAKSQEYWFPFQNRSKGRSADRQSYTRLMWRDWPNRFSSLASTSDRPSPAASSSFRLQLRLSRSGMRNSVPALAPWATLTISAFR